MKEISYSFIIKMNEMSDCELIGIIYNTIINRIIFMKNSSWDFFILKNAIDELTMRGGVSPGFIDENLVRISSIVYAQVG